MQKKYFFPTFILLFWAAQLLGQSSKNMSLIAKWDDPSLVGGNFGGQKYSACWGMAIGGREYAILGSLEFTIILDITTPATPKVVGKFPGVNCTWREFKSYKNRIYVANDCGGGLQIIDMTKAPDTIKMTYNSKALVSSMHTITLDTVSGRIYGNSVQVVLDVATNPDNPVSLNAAFSPCLQAHDTYVRNDTIYASAGSAGYLVCDYKDPKQPKLLAQTTTGGYNHNSWLTRDGRYAYYTEEIPNGRPIQIVDLSNLKNGDIEVVGRFFNQLIPSVIGASRAIPHNVYIKDNLLFNSQYEDGLLVYDIRYPTSPVLAGWYDTYPQNTKYNDYRGCWGNYPWLPSGVILASDMHNGLSLLKLNYSVGTAVPTTGLDFQLLPNPVTDYSHVAVSAEHGEWQYHITDVNGRVQRTGSSTPEINWKDLVPGIYFLKIVTDLGNVGVRKVVKR